MDKNNAQLRLRSAFRYGYFAFIIALLGVFAVVVAMADGLAFVRQPALLLMSGFVGMVGLGLIVPLFLATWLLVGGAILQGKPDKA